MIRTRSVRSTGIGALGLVAAGMLLSVLALPVVALGWSVSWADITTGVTHPLFGPAVWLSLKTTVISLAIAIVCGTPLGWWLANTRSRWGPAVELVVELPIVIPPAVVGVGLLQAFGPRGLDLAIGFTTPAVVLAQLVVAAPFFVQAAASAFRRLDPDLMLVAKTLGASNSRAFLDVAVPIAMPGLVVGASLAWARALGEFGATLLFAGNMTGRTQTMPLAIFTALEADVQVAVVLSLALAALGALLLLLLRAPGWSRGAR